MGQSATERQQREAVEGARVRVGKKYDTKK
jgi:hypothetical protein